MLANLTLTHPAPTRDRPAPPLHWSVLVEAFELACLARCTTASTLLASRPTRVSTPDALIAEFDRPNAAARMSRLLAGLDIPVDRETVTAGLRRRYELHRIWMARSSRLAYLTTTELAWRRGRTTLFSPPTAGVSTVRRMWLPQLAAAAWRAALVGAGRHVRKSLLGVRVTDQDLAGVLVRSACVLGVTAELQRRQGSLLVSVTDAAEQKAIQRYATDPIRSLLADLGPVEAIAV